VRSLNAGGVMSCGNSRPSTRRRANMPRPQLRRYVERGTDLDRSNDCPPATKEEPIARDAESKPV